MTAVVVILAVYTVAGLGWAVWDIRRLWRAAGADIEALIDATREHHGLPPRLTDAELEALVRDAFRTCPCTMCQAAEDEEAQR
jgi:hypothetical protein